MDSLRIVLLVIGVIFIALVYAWGRMKRDKDETRYARWGGVADEGTETHIIGRNSGDLETDSILVDSAYDVEIDPRYDDEIDDVVEPETEPEPDFVNADIEDDWQTQVTASLAEESVQADVFPENDDVDLDSDPELQTSPLDEITSELEALEEIITVDYEPDQIELGDIEIPMDDPDDINSQPDRVIAVHVLAREGSVFRGADILSSLMHLGMQFGDMNVFHCMGNDNKSIFSLVNAVEPGIFDLSKMDDMSTPALLLMMSLPNQLPALEAFDGMLETARSLATSLDGRLCDDRRSVLTRQAIDELRAELTGL